MMPVSQSGITLSKGLKFWWYQHGRRLLTMQVNAIKRNVIQMIWAHYKGLATNTEPMAGKIEWTFEEYVACHNKVYVEPVTEKDLKPNEELCKSCNGTYFEVERDFEILACVWCMNKGKREKVPLIPAPKKRSPLHPEIK